MDERPRLKDVLLPNRMERERSVNGLLPSIAANAA